MPPWGFQRGAEVLVPAIEKKASESPAVKEKREMGILSIINLQKN